MTTLVTGGTGFVGSNIVRALAERGHQVVCFDLVPPNDLVQGYIEPWRDRIRFVQGSILNVDEVDRLESLGIDRIVHAAVFTGILPEIEAGQSRSIVEINVAGTTNVLELASQIQPERFLYVSSGSVYGDQPDSVETLQEDIPVHPRSLYALTKYTSELLTRRYGELHSFDTVSVRLGSPYGPMERVTGHRENQSLLKSLTGGAVRGETIQLADPSIGQQFTYVTDIAEGITTVLDAPKLSYDVYNNSSPQWSSIGKVVSALKEINPQLSVVEDASDADALSTTGSSLLGRRASMDVSRIREDLGFIARHDLASGLRAYMDWRESTGFID